jgi:flagellar capping protein FliD
MTSDFFFSRTKTIMSDVSLSSISSNLLSGSIKWTGLGSGTDFGTVVDQLVELEKTNMYRLEEWRKEWVAKIESLEKLDSYMDSLRLNAGDLNSYSEFYTRTATSSDSSVVTVTNTSMTDTGTHSVVVGEDIVGQIISRPWEETAAVGGAAGSTMTITVGETSVDLVEGVDWDSTGDINQLAADIMAAAGSIVEDVLVVDDKVRADSVPGGPGTYKRLVIVAKDGGTDNQISVTDPTDLAMDEKGFDDPFYTPGEGWLSNVQINRTATGYTGSTNKTFSFRMVTLGTMGEDDIEVEWADDEGNSGSFTVTADDPLDGSKTYSIAQGLEVWFTSTGGDNRIFSNDHFTIDAHAPTLQTAQDRGLAQVEKRVHKGFMDLITPITTSAAEFSYRYAGETFTVSVQANAKLEDLAAAINDDPDNKNVVASVINDGLGTATSYHLVLTGKETGAEHTIEIVSETLTDLDAGEADFEVAQQATDAMIKVDGYPSDDYDYIHRSTNTVGDLIDGVVFELHDTGESTITIANDTASIKAKIEQFVQSVNFVLDYIRQETKYDSETKEAGVMIGNYSYDMVRNAINEILTASIPGLDQETDTYTVLSQIGIETDPDNDGQWIVNSGTLDDALNNDLEAVARLFVLDTDHNGQTVTGVAEQLKEKLDIYTDSESGIANILIDNYTGIISGIDDKIAQEERRIALVRERLEEKFARLETALGKLNGQSEYIESQLKKLPNVGSS